jgi:hypothetical protein
VSPGASGPGRDGTEPIGALPAGEPPSGLAGVRRSGGHPSIAVLCKCRMFTPPSAIRTASGGTRASASKQATKEISRQIGRVQAGAQTSRQTRAGRQASQWECSSARSRSARRPAISQVVSRSRAKEPSTARQGVLRRGFVGHTHLKKSPQQSSCEFFYHAHFGGMRLASRSTWQEAFWGMPPGLPTRLMVCWPTAWPALLAVRTR